VNITCICAVYHRQDTTIHEPEKQRAMTTVLVAIVCITVMFLYSVYKVFEWYNPHVDELVESGSAGPQNEDSVTHKWARIKRIYKNGTITYTQKTWKI
jgi:hypothetical protein